MIPELTVAVIRRFAHRYHVTLSKEEITDVYGSQEGIAHIALSLCDPGDVVLVPNPGYPIFSIGPSLALADVRTYDLKPEMSAPQVCEKLLDAIRSEKYDVIVINFANPDMVGHTGVISAAIKAIETVDECVGKAVQAVKDVDGVLFICADHGNAEQMIDYTTGQPHTAHTTNPVPFILVNYDTAYTLKEGGCLADIVPTLINVMGMEQPAEMTGKSLLIKK